MAGAVRIEGNFGGAGFTPAPGQFDGDVATDLAVYEASTGSWIIKQSSDSMVRAVANFGGPTFGTVAGDYDADSTLDLAVYETALGNWFVDLSGGGARDVINFGGTGFTAAR